MTLHLFRIRVRTCHFVNDLQRSRRPQKQADLFPMNGAHGLHRKSAPASFPRSGFSGMAAALALI